MILIVSKTKDRYSVPTVQTVLFSTVESPALWARAKVWASGNREPAFVISVPDIPHPTRPDSVLFNRGCVAARNIGRAVFGLEIPD